jgi:tRNA(fMet)-specific endonuclease VapC
MVCSTKQTVRLSKGPWKMPGGSILMADRARGILLDTSAIVAHLRGRIDVFVLTAPTEPLFVPLVALGELYKGAEKSANSARNRQLVDDFLQIAALLYPDSATAESYAKAAVALEAKGQMIPENDLWIAAVALECDMPLATRDAHFQRVDGLDVIPW